MCRNVPRILSQNLQLNARHSLVFIIFAGIISTPITYIAKHSTLHLNMEANSTSNMLLWTLTHPSCNPACVIQYSVALYNNQSVVTTYWTCMHEVPKRQYIIMKCTVVL